MKNMTVTEAVFLVARWWGPKDAPLSTLKKLGLMDIKALKQILLDEKQDGEDENWPTSRNFKQATRIILDYDS